MMGSAQAGAVRDDMGRGVMGVARAQRTWNAIVVLV